MSNTFQKFGHIWRTHKKGKPMPCLPMTHVRVLFQAELTDVKGYIDTTAEARHWDWETVAAWAPRDRITLKEAA